MAGQEVAGLVALHPQWSGVVAPGLTLVESTRCLAPSPRPSGSPNPWLFPSLVECFLLDLSSLKCVSTWNFCLYLMLNALLQATHNFSLFFPSHRYFIFTSFWAYKVYYVYGFTLLVIFILIVVTGCSTVVCTYFLLNAEDYRW